MKKAKEAPLESQGRRSGAARPLREVTPYQIYASLDLGPGGYAIAPSTDVKRAVRRALKKKYGR